ncbi:MAG: carbamate kinase [Acidimicrobiales bacterium]
MARTAVVALGGNALTRQGQPGTYEEQLANAREMARGVAALWRGDWRVVIAHGNGPHVGQLAIQQRAGATVVPAQPLFSLVAMTQGQIGSLLTLALLDQLGGEIVGVVSVTTHVVVQPDDPAFAAPSKPIGPFMEADEAAAAASTNGWTVADDAGRGLRRVVPSPEPLAVVEAPAIEALTGAGYLVIACGGGGVPVAMTDRGYEGVDAVVDKDYAAQRLATAIAAEALVLVTGVPNVQLDFGTPSQRPEHVLTVDEAERHLARGQFAAGSMGPKVDASIRFLRDGGSVAVITTPRLVVATLEGPVSPLEGLAGTRIVRSDTTVEASEA